MKDKVMVEEPKRRGRPPGAKNLPKETIVAKPKVARVDLNKYQYVEDDDDDRLKIRPEMIPDGMDYQWITDSIFGQLQPQRRARFERKAWTPVPAERHDGMFMPRGYKGEINVDGLVLMERPMEYTDMARNKDKRAARDQVAVKEAQLRGGDVGTTLDGHHQSAVRTNKIRKSFEPLQVPED